MACDQDFERRGITADVGREQGAVAGLVHARSVSGGATEQDRRILVRFRDSREPCRAGQGPRVGTGRPAGADRLRRGPQDWGGSRAEFASRTSPCRGALAPARPVRYSPRQRIDSARRRAVADLCIPFARVGRSDVTVVGGKGANLGELARAGLPVPGGFVVTAEAFLATLDAAGIRATLRQRFDALKVEDSAALEATSRESRDLVLAAKLPAALRDAVADAYRAIGGGRVAVRSSATAEDSATTSFAGMHETFTNVHGDAALEAAIVRCFASAYAPRVLAYRKARGLRDEPVLAVVVQAMVDSERSGVMFTADPSSGDRTKIVIEGAFGLGEVVVGGLVEPDTYVVAKDGPRLESARIGVKPFRIERGADGVERRVEHDAARARERVLTDAEVVELATFGQRIEAHYGSPQDIEWARAGGRWSILQTRPITTLDGSAPAPERPAPSSADALVQGLGAAPGIASGKVRVLNSPAEGSKLEAGDVLVAPMTAPDWVPTLRRAAAVVTDGGGMTCHAAIVSRELRIPCIVGARTATRVLRDGELVTVDGAKGRVTAGAPPVAAAPSVPATAKASAAGG
ncbi:MAG: hypothetical protein JNL94_14795, partial [Planctomycetes bacterium]|nr:hypothetical protein [Planctomycetota bacterium]